MKRKVIQIADSTQLISLPRKWAQAQGIKKGDEIDVEEKGNSLIITSTINTGTEHKKIEMDVTGIDRDSLVFVYRGLYIKGYDEIKFNYDDQFIPHFRRKSKDKVISVIHLEVNRSVGFEIIQERKDYCVLKNISLISQKEFDSVLKRIFLLILDAANDFYTGLKNNDDALIETLEEKHDTITRLIVYNLRTLNKTGYKDSTNTHFLFHIVSSLDNVIDILRNTAYDITNRTISPTKKSLPIVEAITVAFKTYFDLFYNFDFKKVGKFVEARDDARHMVRKLKKTLSVDDVILCVSLNQCLYLFGDIYSSRVGMLN